MPPIQTPRLLSSVCIALVLAGPASFALEALPPIKDSRLLTDFTADMPRGQDNADVSLLFEGIRPLRSGQTGNVTVQLQFRGGKFADKGHRASADYNQVSANTAAVRSASINGQNIEGDVAVTIGYDSPRPGQKGFPNPADEFSIKFAARIEQGKSTPYIDDTDQFMPPWRKDNIKFGGTLITGEYTATLSGRESKGKLVGAISPPPLPGVFGAQGNIHLAGADGGGAAILARLAPRRVAAPEGARIVKELPKPEDWREFDGLRVTVTSPRRRDDAAVALGIREADGAWYGVTGAAMLLGRQATFVVPFADFRRTGGFDPSYFLDLDKVIAFSIGVDNPLGVGDVEFVVRKVELVRWADRPAAEPPAAVSVDADVNVVLNGVGQVPKGLFGFHAVNAPKTLDAPPEGKPPVLDYIKRINPGYFRPLDHVGWGGKNPTDEQIKAAQQERAKAKAKPSSIFYQMAQAANAVDNIVWCHTVGLWSRPPWMEGDRAKLLENIRLFYRDRGADGWTPGDDFNMLRRLEVWNEPFMWGRWINMGRFLPGGATDWKDPTQFGYIPAKVGTDAYCDIFEAAHAGARSANPHVLLGGPSAPAYNADDYSNFENHVARFIDRCHDKIDFLTEHHYQGEADSYAASYVVAGAYGDVKFGKRLVTWNTECNDLVDTPTKGAGDEPPSWSLKADQLNKAHYNILDILTCARVCPDLAPGRAMHALWSGYCRSQGETDAYTILSTLRGAVLDVRSPDPALVAMATCPDQGRLVVLVFNNSPRPRKLALTVPPGFALQATARLIFEDGTKIIDADEPRAEPVPDQDRPVVNVIAARGVTRWTFVRPNYKPAKTRHIEASFADCVLARVAPDKPVSGKIVWRGQGPGAAKAAWLRLVTRGVDRGEALAVINGQAIPLPWSSSNDACEVVQDVAIDPAILKAQTAVEFRCADPSSGNGFTVWAAGITVER